VRTLDWDSRFFGLRIAQVDPPSAEQDVAEFLAAAREQYVDCLFCLVRADALAQQWLLESAGFVARDLRLEFHRSVSPIATDESGLRRWIPGDVDSLARTAATAFHATRYAADPHFPRDAVARLYETWLRNSCAGFADEVLVLGPPGAAQGFVTLHVDASRREARIGLIAVAGASRGSGAGRRLVEGAMAWVRRRDCHDLCVVTQGSNVAAQRLYQRCGFVTHSAKIWYHAWPAPAATTREDHP